MAESLLIGSDGAVRVLTLNRPERLNALDAALRQSLVDAMDAAARDDAVRVTVVTGAGDRAFCAGQDLNESQGVGSGAGAEQAAGWIDTWARFFDAFARHPKPIVAALNGTTAGAGLEIAMMAHLRVAVPAARLVMAEINIGLPTLMGSYLVNSHVFLSRMVDIVLSGREFSAKEAHEIGLVHRLASPARVMAEAMAAAQLLASKPPNAMRLNIKRFNDLRAAEMERQGTEEAMRAFQREAMASGEPQRVMAEFLAERARRKQTAAGKPGRAR